MADEAFNWERGIDEVAEGDDDMAGYIEQLEKTRDEVESAAASGDAIAMEFEKFLRASDEKSVDGADDRPTTGEQPDQKSD